MQVYKLWCVNSPVDSVEKNKVNPGLYERLLDEELAELLRARPDLRCTLEKLDNEIEPSSYSGFIHHLLLEVLPSTKPDARIKLINRIIELVAAEDGLDYTKRRRLLSEPKTLLTQIRPIEQQTQWPHPETPLSISSLLTGSADDPPLEREIRTELLTCDRVEILVSFVKWSGLSLLIAAFEELEIREVPVRIITTSYMGASDPHAIEWLAMRRNVSIRISYDTERTRLHAKAYHFHRKSGYSTAYIGSANMSRPAMTSGLEWTVKVTAQDMPHVLARFAAEFETYWFHESFVPYDASQAARFREAILKVRNSPEDTRPRFFADLKPHPFQERVLESIAAARQDGSMRNLVVAATGTGKTVMAAFDYARFLRNHPEKARLLFVAHRKEILHQARDCFRAVLRDFNFGDLLVDGNHPAHWDAVFASVQSLNQQRPWERLGDDYFRFLIVDEAHHGTADSYRPLFEHLRPEILLGLTATPERMDGSSILPDFGNRFAAEIRLPEALEEKLLCPFHYFGVTDPISTADERFWRNGKYDSSALEAVYTGDDMRALQRLDVIHNAIQRYHPDLTGTRAVGFCAGVKHAEFMARKFQEMGYAAGTILGETSREVRDDRLRDFRRGNLQFLFVVDVLSEGIDVPEINLVLFLRPTESLTVFLQQLGRGLRHAPEKECLTVLDFVGQCHRRYRMDRKFTALLRHTRRRIDNEIERDFPNLPPGCSIQFERVARQHILDNIRRSLGDLQNFVPEAIRTFTAETKLPLTFGNFVGATDISPVELLNNKTWSEWKDLADGTHTFNDPDHAETLQAMRRFALRTDRVFLDMALQVTNASVAEEPGCYGMTNEQAAMLHYALWGKDGGRIGVCNYRASFQRWLLNPSSARDLAEIIEWRRAEQAYPTFPLRLSFACPLQIHASYGLREITAAFGLANLQTSGPAGTGVIRLKVQSVYLHLVTFRKEEKDFAPTTRYKDYPISPTLLHWESQSNTALEHAVGQDYIHFRERGYTILFFARVEKRIGGETAPYVFLGPASNLISHEGSRPIQMVWELEYAMPAAFFEAGRTA